MPALIDKVIWGLVASVATGVMWWVWDLNTMDPEVKPILQQQVEATEKLGEIVQQNQQYIQRQVQIEEARILRSALIDVTKYADVDEDDMTGADRVRLERAEALLRERGLEP